MFPDVPAAEKTWRMLSHTDSRRRVATVTNLATAIKYSRVHPCPCQPVSLSTDILSRVRWIPQ